MHVFSTIYRYYRIALRGQEEFSTADHSAYLRKGRAEVRKQGVRQEEEFLKNTLTGFPVQDARRLQRGGEVGGMDGVHPSMVNGTELGAQEWRDTLFL